MGEEEDEGDDGEEYAVVAEDLEAVGFEVAD